MEGKIKKDILRGYRTKVSIIGPTKNLLLKQFLITQI